jgi:hypothetical protein
MNSSPFLKYQSDKSDQRRVTDFDDRAQRRSPGKAGTIRRIDHLVVKFLSAVRGPSGGPLGIKKAAADRAGRAAPFGDGSIIDT